ncbi:MAG: hypothetical protein ABJH63_00110 [Rhizobiaceae bacterium]
MKKSTKSTTSNKAQSPRNQRRASSKSKPVTIDLQAEKVTPSKPEPKVKAAAASSARTATPKVKKSSSPLSSADSAPVIDAKTSEKAEGLNFGRNAKSGDQGGAKPAAPPKPEPTKKHKTSSGRMGRFAAALIGGGVALGGAGLLQFAGLLPTPGQSNQADPASIQELVASQTNTLRTELTDLSNRLDSLNSSSGNGNIDSDLSSQIDSVVSKRLSELAPNSADAELDTVITQVNETTIRVEKLLTDQQANAQTISELQSAVSSGAAGGGAAVSALSLQVENLTERSSKLAQDLAQLNAGVDKLSVEASTRSTSVNEDLVDRLAKLEQQAQNLPTLANALNEAQSTIAANSQSLQQQSENVDRLTASLNKPNSAEKLAARAVAAAALKNDIDRGLPFESSLTILQNLSGGDAQLEQLAAFAQAGVPTPAQLTNSFSTISDTILAATEPAPGEDLSSRLLAGVKSFVKVKPRKELEGTTPIAIVSQISQSLRDGELNAASQLWATLPEAGQNASMQWHDQLQSRITANGLISSSVQSFLNSTATQ